VQTLGIDAVEVFAETMAPEVAAIATMERFLMGSGIDKYRKITRVRSQQE